jgi:hypothetical protein
MTHKTLAMFDPTLLKPAIADSFRKLNPAVQWRNPVMFVVYVGSILTTAVWVQALVGQGDVAVAERPGFILAVALWLWFTVLFANFAEALAEGRSKAQAASLRGLKKETWAKKLREPTFDSEWHTVPATDLRKGDVFVVHAGETLAADGDVIEGVASVDESAITGESAPVIREAGGDFSAVTGGTRVLSDWLVVRVSVNPGETFVDRMIAMVENAKRQKTDDWAPRKSPKLTASALEGWLSAVAKRPNPEPFSVSGLPALCDNLNALAAWVATDAHLDPDSPYLINRTQAFDKIKRQIGRWLLAATATTRGVKIVLKELALNLQRFVPDRHQPRPQRPKPHLFHAYKAT